MICTTVTRAVGTVRCKHLSLADGTLRVNPTQPAILQLSIPTHWCAVVIGRSGYEGAKHGKFGAISPG